MEATVKLLGGSILALGGIMLLVCLGSLFGVLSGWIVGLVFGDTILNILSQLGVRNVAMWQVGCFLGFVGGFLKTKVSATVSPAK